MGERIRLDVPATPGFFSTVRRVLGGLGARLGYSLDDLDDLYLGTEELVRSALRREPLERIHLEAVIGADHLEVTVGPFTSPELRADVASDVAACDGIDLCRMLRRTMDEVRVSDGPSGSFHVVLLRRLRSRPG
jgi:hypothetical protein